MTREFKIGDFVRYTPEDLIPAEGYVIGYASDPFKPDDGEIYPVVAADTWHTEIRNPETLAFLSEGHIETAYRLRERWAHSPFAQLLPLPDDPAHA
jgi:hypothetical protein